MNKTFKQHKNLKEYWETSDGTKFFVDGDARNHAKTLTDKNVKHVKRDAEKAAEEPENEDQDKKNSPLDQNTKKVSEYLATVETVEELDELLALEEADQDRKGVKTAIEARKEELTKKD